MCLARLRRLLARVRGPFFVQYSSLALLVAIAAIAIFARLAGIANSATP